MTIPLATLNCLPYGTLWRDFIPLANPHYLSWNMGLSENPSFPLLHFTVFHGTWDSLKILHSPSYTSLSFMEHGTLWKSFIPLATLHCFSWNMGLSGKPSFP